MNILISILLTVSLFQELPADNEKHSIMYFFNPDCPSCREIAPFIEYLKEEYEAVIYSYNTRTPIGYRYGMQHQIMYVPTLIIKIERGDEEEIQRYEGAGEIKEAEAVIAKLNGFSVQTRNE
jgi:thiol-disulfide isomerase/thioredoxin